MEKKDPLLSKHQLGNLIDRYKRILRPPQASVEKEVIEVVKEMVGIELKPSQVTYTVSTRTISITAPSVIRSELKQVQQAILNELKNRLGVEHAPKAIL